MFDPILVFSLFVVAASLLGFVFLAFRLPLIIAYITAGLVLGLFVVSDGTISALSFLPEVGLAFLLFLLGIELDVREIRHFGRQIIFASVAQMVLSTAAGFLIASFLGFGRVDAIFLGLGLAFSSTIIVVKLFVDKKELSSLHGKMAVGILLFEDLVAVVALMFLTLRASALNIGLTAGLPFLAFVLKGMFLFGVALVFARVTLPFFFKTAASSPELLFLSGIGLCFAFIALALVLGFGLSIGAFLAGVSLASSSYRHHIAARIKPLRDLFITLFFVDLGLRVAFSFSAVALLPIAFFTLYALLAKPTIFMGLLGLLGYKKHTSFLTSVGLSQISEFSLILLVVGQSTGQVGEGSLSTLAVAALASMALSSVAVTHATEIYKRASKPLSFFERKGARFGEYVKEEEIRDHILLLGCDRAGRMLLPVLKKSDQRFLVADFNPEVVRQLTADGFPVLFGDISDPEFAQELNADKAKILISTIGDPHDNAYLLNLVKGKGKKPIFIASAETPAEALKLYEQGADLVLVPHMITGEYIADVLSGKVDKKALLQLRDQQFKSLALERTTYL